VSSEGREEAKMQNRANIAAVYLVIALAGCSTGTQATPTPTAATPTATPAASPTPTPAPTPPAVAGHIEVGGLTREYLVVAPLDVAERDALPLLLALHGRTGTIADAETISGYDTMAVDPGAVVVYPQGYKGSWNAGTCCEEANRESVDDVGFLRALIDRMEADYPIDPTRVFIVGGSNGGEMAERAACELSDRIAAIADVVGTLLVDCQPSQPVSVIAIHGTADTMIPIAGGLTDDPSCQDAPCPAFADVMERWRQMDGCTGDPSTAEDNYTVETTFSTCGAGTTVTFIKAIGKGHGWYTSHPDDRAVTWDFFMNHPRSTGTS
jgi:polyhydroxybutyrate depolymerase